MIREVELYKPKGGRRLKKAPQRRVWAKKRPRNRKTGKLVKITTWKLVKADKSFSEKIRTRDGKCLFPNCKISEFGALQCSHYIGRATKSTRFDPDNCIALCWFHHFKSKDLGFEYQKQTMEKHGFDGQYTLFMKKHLGDERWNALIERAKQHISQKTAITTYQQALEELPSNPPQA